MRKIPLIIVVGLLLGIQARGSLVQFELTYTGGGVSGSGLIKANNNGDGTYSLAEGSFTITQGAGNYSYVDAVGQAVVTSPPGYNFPVYGGTVFYPVDDVLHPGQPSLLDLSTGGLAFNDPNFTGPGGNGLAFAIYSNGGGAGGYGIVFNGAGNQPWADFHDGGTLSLTAVPEPTTMIAGALLLLPVGMSTLRALRRRTA